MEKTTSHIVAGRIVGLFAGLTLFGNIKYLVVCVVIGVVFDVLYARYVFPRRYRDVLLQRYSTSVVELCAKMCKSDGVVTREEIDAFRSRLVIAPEDMPLVSTLFNRAKKSTVGFEGNAQEIRTVLANNPTQLSAVVEVLYEIALSDKYIAPGERAFILRVAEIFNLSPLQLQEIERRLTVGTQGPSSQYAKDAKGRANYSRGQRQEQNQNEHHQNSGNPFERSAITGKDPYKILGIKEGVGKDAIKSAYRKLVAKNHPDKLRGDGATDQEVKRAEEKMTELNAAYAELIRRL